VKQKQERAAAPPREDYVVSVVRPAGVSAAQMAAYIKDAVTCWSGQFEAHDPLFNAFDRPYTPVVRRGR